MHNSYKSQQLTKHIQRHISNNTPQKNNTQNTDSAKTARWRIDFQKCANQKEICKKIIKANQIANKGKTSQGNTLSVPDENKKQILDVGFFPSHVTNCQCSLENTLGPGVQS